MPASTNLQPELFRPDQIDPETAAFNEQLEQLLATAPATAQQPPIKIGVPTSIQLQVGRDTQNAIKMALEDINGKGGLLGRKLEMVAADETENPEQGIAAIKKLTADDKVDVLIGGYTSGVTLAQLPHISNARRSISVSARPRPRSPQR